MIKTISCRLKLKSFQFKILNEMCSISKNIYNCSLYEIRQYYFLNKKYLSYPKLYHIIKENENYKKLPTWVAQQTMKIVDRNFRSFFNLLKRKQEGKYQANIKIPHYKDKKVMVL